MVLFHQDIKKQQVRAALTYWLYLPLLVLGTGTLIDRAADLPSCRFLTAGGILLVTGSLIIHRATSDLARYGKGTPSPCRPAKVLVTEGMYGFCRHPMWLGYDIMALGTILVLGSTGSLTVSFPVFMGAQIVFLRREERILQAKFKKAYLDYQEGTNMLFPSLHQYQTKTGGKQ